MSKVLKKAGFNSVTGAAGNDTKGQRSLEEKHHYDASELDSDRLRDEREELEELKGTPQAKDDKFHENLEEKRVNDKLVASEKHNDSKINQGERRSYRNRLKESVYASAVGGAVSEAAYAAAQTPSNADDEAVARVKDELTFGDDVGDIQETPGLDDVKKSATKAVNKCLPSRRMPSFVSSTKSENKTDEQDMECEL